MARERIEKLAPMYSETVLARGARAQAAIVAPAEDMALIGQARILQTRLREITGARLPIIAPSDALAAWPPRRHLIALGVMGTNRLIEKLYFEYFTVMDHAFPGAGGFAIQTVHNPCGNGKNVVVLGGTETDALEAGIERLCAAVRTDGGSAEIGHLVAVSARGQEAPEVLPTYIEDARDLAARLGKDFNNARMLLNHSTQAGLHYLMSGDAAHLEAFKVYVRAHRGLGVPGVGTHMEMWRTLAIWDAVEESPAFTDTERLEIVNHFLDLLYSHEGVNYGFFRQGLTQKGVRHNHQTLPALCALFGGRYFGRHYGRKDAAQWLKDAATLFATQALSYKPMCDSGGYQWFTLDTMATYALVSGDMTFFENGSCRRACDLALMCMANRGAVPNFGDGGTGDVMPIPILSAAAYVYRDGRYQHAIDGRPRPLGRGFVTDGIEDRGWPEYDGVHAFPMDPQFYRLARDSGKGASEANRTMAPGVPLAKAFDKVAFRDGMHPDGAFLLLDGITMGSHAHDDGNSILEFSAFQKQFLVEKTYTEGTNLQDHNAVSVVHNGETSRPPGACSLEALANLPTVGFSATQMSGLSGADWRRHIVWQRGGVFVVMDALMARSSGRYRYRCFFRSLGAPTLDGDRFCVVQDDRAHRETGKIGPDATRFHIRSADAGGSLLERDSGEFGRYWVNYPWAEATVNILSRTLRVRRRAGQADWFVSLLYAHPASICRDIGIRRLGDSWALLAEGDARTLIGVSVASGEAQKLGAVSTDARTLFVDGDRLAMVDGRWAEVGGWRVTAGAPVSVEWSFAGEITVEATRPARITVEVERAVHRLKAPAGRSEHALPRVDAEPVRQFLVGLDRRADCSPKAGDPRDRSLVRSSDLKVRRLYRGTSELTDVRVLDGKDEVTLAAGTADGTVLGLSGSGTVCWQHRTEGRIHSVAAADVDRDGRVEVIAGSDDAHTYLLDSSGKVRWAYQAPPYFGYWSHYKSHCESRKVATADLNGDGRDEILAAVGNLKLYALSADGEVLWTHEHYGTPTMFAVADVNGDGRPEVMVGTGDFGCNSNCFVLSASGDELCNLHNDGWSSRLTAIAVAPLRAGEPPVVLFGTSKYHVAAWRLDGEMPRRLWQVGFGDVIRTLAVVEGGERGNAVVVAGSASDYVSGISADGKEIWTRYLASVPTAAVPIPGHDGVLVGTENGEVYHLDGRRGRAIGRAKLDGTVNGIDLLRTGGKTTAFVAAGKVLEKISF